jgi:hypothetical protein
VLDCQITYIFKYARVIPEHRNSDEVTFSCRCVGGNDLDCCWGGGGGGWSSVWPPLARREPVRIAFRRLHCAQFTSSAEWRNIDGSGAVSDRMTQTVIK